jgi:hypothetical protein
MKYKPRNKNKSDLMEMIFNTLNIRLKEMSIDLERNILVDATKLH